MEEANDRPRPDAAGARLPALHGVRVLDLSRVLAGPSCTMTLADLGAEVIKVENPVGGDDTRAWGPPYRNGESAYFLGTNRGKKSIAVDLSTPDGQEVVRALAMCADVLVENFRLGALERFGLDYATLSRLNPRLIYCSISGYGRDSPLADRPGYDYVVQAEGGLMSITGERDGPPMKVGVAVADLFTGMAATQAVLAALIARERDQLGQHIDLALFDCQLAMLANVGSAYLVSGENPRRYGNGHPTVVPYQVFETRDGEIVVAVGNDRQFRVLCDSVLDCPDLARDARFETNAGRVVNRDALIARLCELFAARGSGEWIERLQRTGIPTASVRSVGEALESPEARARGMIGEVCHPAAGSVRMVLSPLRMSGTPVVPPSPPPMLGEHTEAVLAELLGVDAVAARRLPGGGASG